MKPPPYAHMFTNKKFKILHIFNDPKFSADFFEFLIQHNVKLDDQFLFHYRCRKSTCNNYGMQAIFAPHFFSLIPNLLMLNPLFRSEKIIIHSLASPFLLLYLYIFPSLAHKSYWAIWGKDLYYYKTLKQIRFYHNIYEFFRKRVIKEIRHIIGFSQEDYELARKWYGSTAELHKCFMYPSNCYKEIPTPGKKGGPVILLVGNSADPSNNHIEAFSLLEKYKHDDIKIITPLSYGDNNYAKQVIKVGKRLFGRKYAPIEELLPLADYLDLLARVDIGIFAHKRQQAMGNIITLLGMKKKVYIRNDITTWKTLEYLGVKIYDLYDLNLLEPDKQTMKNNHSIIKMVFSEENLLHQWNKISDHKPKA